MPSFHSWTPYLAALRSSIVCFAAVAATGLIFHPNGADASEDLAQDPLSKIEDFLAKHRIQSIAEAMALPSPERATLNRLVAAVPPGEALSFHGIQLLKQEQAIFAQPESGAPEHFLPYLAQQLVVLGTRPFELGAKLNLNPDQAEAVLRAHATTELFLRGDHAIRGTSPSQLENPIVEGQRLARRLLADDANLQRYFGRRQHLLKGLLDGDSSSLLEGLVCRGVLEHFDFDGLIEPYETGEVGLSGIREPTSEKLTRELKTYHVDLATLGLIGELEPQVAKACPSKLKEPIDWSRLKALEINYLGRKQTLISHLEKERLTQTRMGAEAPGSGSARKQSPVQNQIKSSASLKRCLIDESLTRSQIDSVLAPPQDFAYRTRAYQSVGKVETCDLQYEIIWSPRSQSFSGTIRSLAWPDRIPHVCFKNLKTDSAAQFFLAYVQTRVAGTTENLSSLGPCKN